jgi:hypothetical protein
MADLPEELQPKPDNYFYKKHSDHAGFKPPSEPQSAVDSQPHAGDSAFPAGEAPVVTVQPPSAQ